MTPLNFFNALVLSPTKILQKSTVVSGVKVQVSGFKKRRVGWEAIRLESWMSWKRECFQAFWPPGHQAMGYELSATSYLPDTWHPTPEADLFRTPKI